MSTVMCTHHMLPKSTALFTYLSNVHVSQQHISTQSCALALAHLFCHNNTLPLMSTVLCTHRMSPKSTALFTYLSTVHISQQHIVTHVNSSVHLPCTHQIPCKHMASTLCTGKTPQEFENETQTMINKAQKMWSKWEKMTMWSNQGLTLAAEAALKMPADSSSG